MQNTQVTLHLRVPRHPLRRWWSVFFLTQVSRVGHRYGQTNDNSRRKKGRNHCRQTAHIADDEMLLYVHRKRTFIRDRNPGQMTVNSQNYVRHPTTLRLKEQNGRPPRLSQGSIKTQRTERTSTPTFTRLLSFETLMNTCLVLSVNHHVPSLAFCARHVWSVSCVPRRFGEVTRGDPKMASRPHKYSVWERVGIRFVRFFCSTEPQRQKFSSIIDSKK